MDTKDTIENVPAQLQWIEGEPQPDKELPLAKERKKRQNNKYTKFADKVLIPTGLFATLACLSMGIYSLKSGNRKRQQLFMKGRVLFQALTIGVMGIGIALSMGIIGPKENDVKASDNSDSK